MSNLLHAVSTTTSRIMNENPSVASTALVIVSPLVLLVATVFGQILSALTRGCIEFNTFIPERFRILCQDRVGQPISRDVIERVNRVVGYILPPRGRNDNLYWSVIASPIVEETFFRLPLLLASWTMDSSPTNVINNFTGTGVVKTFLAMALSIVFIYAHGANPNPGRAAQLFSSRVIFILSHP